MLNKYLLYSENELLYLEDTIQSYLIKEGVRQAYLIQNFETSQTEINKRIYNILQKYPNLFILQNHNNFFVSKHKLDASDVLTQEQIGKILGFECGDQKFDKINRENTFYTYYINIILHNEQKINLITYIHQTRDYVVELNNFKEKIEKTLDKNTELQNIIKEIHCEIISNNIKLSIVTEKLIKNFPLTKNEINAINEALFNTMNCENYNKLIKHIDYSNPIHKGIVLSYIANYTHDVLSPLFPLQSTGYMKEIYEIENKNIDLIISFLKQSSEYTKLNNLSN